MCVCVFLPRLTRSIHLKLRWLQRNKLHFQFKAKMNERKINTNSTEWSCIFCMNLLRAHLCVSMILPERNEHIETDTLEMHFCCTHIEFISSNERVNDLIKCFSTISISLKSTTKHTHSKHTASKREKGRKIKDRRTWANTHARARSSKMQMY